ncbi:hypothetical protein [Pseudescherichia sp.]|uniref:hypothetical protein n=1 Tax=Pseudescherichia sp. TaxID=2055881 RepID=UPI0028993EA6|nr:hypothetical protein [Pseudescherichia sp.]
MKIVCLGWGSLVWKSGELPVAGEWHHDGPTLPIEFTRVSDGGELATAICLNAKPVPVLWETLVTSSLSEACQALRKREGIPEERVDGVGSLHITPQTTGVLADWARQRGIDALIWTALPARIDSIEGKTPTVEAAIAYLQGLTGEVREHAKSYIQQVPEQIATLYRGEIRAALGW